MRSIDLDGLENLSKNLTVVHQSTGELVNIELTEEQRTVLRAIDGHRRVIVLKGRQVFVSTACAMYAVMFAMVNPGVKVALVADIRDKAKGLLRKCSVWAKEAHLVIKVDNTEVLQLWNGAEIHSITANTPDAGSQEVKAGRSFSYGLIILSEFAFYNRDGALLASITRSALKGARIVIESTATPAENVYRRIWETGTGWHKVFLSFEQHDAYQLDASTIDDETWADLQAKYSFTSRPHAAYWWQMVQRDLSGDVHRGLREAPILPEHAFAFAEGRWIFRYDATEPTSTDGDWSYYDAPDESGCVFGVDTASGVGSDASAIAVVGRARGNLIAAYRCDHITVPDFIAVATTAVRRWKPQATVVESNGIGAGVYQALSMVLEARAIEQKTHESEKPVRMNLVKLAIESGQIVAGPELEHEVKHSVMARPRRGKGSPLWDGPDDLLNALGFALVHRRDHPYHTTVPAKDPYKYVDRSAYRKKRGASHVW